MTDFPNKILYELELHLPKTGTMNE